MAAIVPEAPGIEVGVVSDPVVGAAAVVVVVDAADEPPHAAKASATTPTAESAAIRRLRPACEVEAPERMESVLRLLFMVASLVDGSLVDGSTER
jgi:hypothetical protein